MKFSKRLLQGTLIKRYKRFFVDIKHKGKIVTSHCPNTGSMYGLLNEGNQVFFSKSTNPKRKLKYTLELIKVKNKLIGINTQLTNKIVLEALKNKKIKSLKHFSNIQSEVMFSANTRFDFLLSNNKKKCFLEVKNVTLFRNKNTAEFPDSVTSRGTKHLQELILAKKKGFESCILYLVQNKGCKNFRIANDIDKKYYFFFKKALQNNVKVLCYDCKLSDKEIKLNNQIIYDKKL